MTCAALSRLSERPQSTPETPHFAVYKTHLPLQLRKCGNTFSSIGLKSLNIWKPRDRGAHLHHNHQMLKLSSMSRRLMTKGLSCGVLSYVRLSVGKARLQMREERDASLEGEEQDEDRSRVDSRTPSWRALVFTLIYLYICAEATSATTTSRSTRNR